jgi:SAM-dependent methyltransferase
MLDFDILERYLDDDSPDSHGTARIWTDPHISEQLLSAHLDPEHDAASRRPAAIDATLAWIRARVGAGPFDILDLGCGPGLYAERLASAGHRVAGIDFSERSIAYARRSARERGLSIEYRLGDYLEAGYGGPFDLILLVYCDFGVLDPGERRVLLDRVRSALKPGGAFVFDALDEGFLHSLRCGRTWSRADSGFWSAEPHLVWEETRHFPELKTVSRKIVVAEPGSGRIECYKIRDSYFSEADIRTALEESGLSLGSVGRNVVPPGDFKGIDPVFYVSRAPAS